MMPKPSQQPRRRFLQQTTLAAAAVWGGRAALATELATGKASRHRQTFSLARASRGDFAALVGTRFTVRTGDDLRVPAILVEAADRTTAGRSPAQSGGRQPFSLLFELTGSAVEQDTHRVSHPALGSFDLFLAPVGPKGPRTTCEAIFG